MKTFSRLFRRYLLAAVGIVLLMFVLGTSFLGWVLWREGQRPQREYSYSNIADSMVQTADGLAFGPQHTPEEWMDGYSWAMVLDADGRVIWSYALPAATPPAMWPGSRAGIWTTTRSSAGRRTTGCSWPVRSRAACGSTQPTPRRGC